MILLDDPDAEQAATLFGRLRDELWQPPVWFTVAVNPSTYTSVLSQPPANAFFDVMIELEPLEPNVAVDMLRRRKHRGELAEEIAEPAQAMQPRAVLLSAEAGPGARYDAELQHELLTRAERAAGRAGAALVAEIWNRGAVSASDADLQRSLGVSRARLTQLLTLLANQGTARFELPGRIGSDRSTQNPLRHQSRRMNRKILEKLRDATAFKPKPPDFELPIV